MIKKGTLLVTLMLATGLSIAQSSDTPEATLQKVFDVANSQEWTELSRICDPMGENDGDTRDICMLAEASKEKQAEFVEYFKTGKIIGKATIVGDKAEVHFTFGPNGDREETMNLVSRRGVWYLASF